MAETMWIRGENGMLHEMSVPLSPHIQGRLDRGDLTRVNEDGTPWTEPAAEPDEPQDNPPPDAPSLPKRTENRQAWIDFAISQGMDREQANNMTKAELVDEFTKHQADGD